MRVSEVIQGTIDLVHGLRFHNVPKSASQGEYANAPQEKTQSIAKIIAGGDDIHHEKHPSDMRSDSVSLYPKQGK